MKNYEHLNQLSLGTCYYPEHWDRSLWAEDLDRMLTLGIYTIRVFEFAWNIVEPHEGKFSFELFDSFLDLAAQKGMKVIMCTPTATPPAWLTEKYPEVLNADMNGHLYYHGHRRHYNYTSPVYHEKTRIICEKLGERYGNHPAIVGWQIDNEINCEENRFFAQTDHAAFREWLRERFGTLDALNAAIGANFWSESYTDWAQIHLSRNNTGAGHGNPHLELLEKRFIAWAAQRYVKLQSDILRRYVGDRFITTNGVFGHLDNHDMTRTALDFLTYDNYPSFAFGTEGINMMPDSGDFRDRAYGRKLDYTRSASPRFGIMEQQSGAGGWDFRMFQPMPMPGQMRLWTWQAIAHGADYVSYFRWRTCGYGTEIYWHGLNDYSNKPNRRLEELARIHGEVEKVRDLAGEPYLARVAVIGDYLNEWDGERDQWHGKLDALSQSAIYEAAQLSHVPLDYVYLPNGLDHEASVPDLSRYALIIWPHATILTEDSARLLEAYVKQGGRLVMGARTGYKDEYGRCPMRAMTGLAHGLCGTDLSDYTLERSDMPVKLNWMGQAFDTVQFIDVLRPEAGGEARGTFVGGYMEGQPAVVSKKYAGGGEAIYFGTGFSVALARRIFEVFGVSGTFDDLVDAPERVELAARGEYLFLLNYDNAVQHVQLRQPLTDAFTGEAVQESIALAPFDVRIFKAR